MKGVALFFTIVFGVGYAIWLLTYFLNEGALPWEPQERADRAQKRRRNQRIAQHMRAGMCWRDATTLVDNEFEAESSAARKAYEEAAS